MSSFIDVKRKCAVCGKESSHRVWTSHSSFGHERISLDLRSSDDDAIRDTWIQQCPFCCYSAPDISFNQGIDEGFLLNKNYLYANYIPFQSNVAKRFYQAYLITKENSTLDALTWIMNAIWISDDACDEISAILCRIEALRVVDTIISKPNLPPAPIRDEYINNMCMRLDLMRRTHNCKAIIDEYGGVELPDGFFNDVVNYQLKLSRVNDYTCHYLDEYYTNCDKAPDHAESSDAMKSEKNTVNQSRRITQPIKDIINFKDAFGKPVQMAYYGDIEYEGKTYAVIAPYTEGGEDEPIVLVETLDDSGADYSAIDDEQIINEVIRLLNELEPIKNTEQADDYDPLDDLMNILKR